MIRSARPLALTAAAAFLALSGPALAATKVGGAEMKASKTIVENASKSKDHETLVKAVKAAGLVETLSGAGPFTVFAPTDDAFAKLPEETLKSLLKPENKEKLAGILTYHVVGQKVMSEALAKMIADGNGTHAIPTVNGATLTGKRDGDKIVLADAKGNTATVTIADVQQSNGVIHVIDTVMLPN